MQLLLMGPPGAGKGTQAAALIKKFSIPQISTGDIFRSAIKEGTEQGKKAKSYIDAGSLVPDEVTIEIIHARLSQSDCAKGFILDGFPRTIAQADALNTILIELNTKLTKVININVPAEELIKRATGRRICKKCGATYHTKFNPPKKANRCDKCGEELFQRTDDNEETIRKRLKVYEESTRPLIEYYKRQGLYTEIDGRQPIEKVTEEMIKTITLAKD